MGQIKQRNGGPSSLTREAGQVRAAGWAECSKGSELASMPLCALLGLAQHEAELEGADRCSIPPSVPMGRRVARGARVGACAMPNTVYTWSGISYIYFEPTVGLAKVNIRWGACRWLALPVAGASAAGRARVQQHPRDAAPCAVRPPPGAEIPREFAAPIAVLDAATRGAAAVARGMGARVHDSGGCGVELHATTPDGAPVLGSHPEFEDGRVIIAAATGASALADRQRMYGLCSRMRGKDGMERATKPRKARWC